MQNHAEKSPFRETPGAVPSLPDACTSRADKAWGKFRGGPNVYFSKENIYL